VNYFQQKKKKKKKKKNKKKKKKNGELRKKKTSFCTTSFPFHSIIIYNFLVVEYIFDVIFVKQYLSSHSNLFLEEIFIID